MGKLVFECCGWFPKNGQEGTFRRSHPMASGAYAAYSINMASEETVERQWDKIEYFYIELTISSFNLLNVTARNEDDLKRMFLLCRERIGTDAMDVYHQHSQILNRYTIAQVLLSEPLITCIRRELKKFFPDVKRPAKYYRHLILPRNTGHLVKRLVWLQMLPGLNIPVLSEAAFDCNTRRCIQTHALWCHRAC